MIAQNILFTGLTVHQGVVSGLQRTTHVSGGGNTSASNAHICIFALGDIRVETRSSSPPPIAEGDQLRIAGRYDNGIFKALALHDLTTSWISPEPRSGCLVSALVGFILFSSIIAVVFMIVGGGVLTMIAGKSGLLGFLILPIAAVVPGLAIWMLCRTIRATKEASAARRLLMNGV